MKAETEHTTEEMTSKESIPMSRRIFLGLGLSLWVLVGFIISSLLVESLLALLVELGALEIGSINESVLSATFAGVVYTLAMIVVIGLPYKVKNIHTTKEELGLTRLPSWNDLLLAPVGFVAYTLFATVLVAAVVMVFPGFDAEQAQEVGFSDISHYYEYVLAFITLVILAPVAEEVLMRGYLYGKLRKFMPIIAATLITSLLFSLMHFQWNVAVSVLPLGIVAVMLREMTGSIWAGVLLHMLKNGVAYYLLFVDTSIINMVG